MDFSETDCECEAPISLSLFLSLSLYRSKTVCLVKIYTEQEETVKGKMKKERLFTVALFVINLLQFTRQIGKGLKTLLI